jgi:HAD superfamily hydrolase (TIGR01509 family)
VDPEQSETSSKGSAAESPIAAAGWELDPGGVEAVFLDAGGVLLNPDWERASEMLRRHGVWATSARLAAAEPVAKRAMDHPGYLHRTDDITRSAGYLGRVLEVSGLPFAPDALAAAARDFEAEHRRSNLWSAMPAEVPAALERLWKRGYRLAVVSNAESNLRDRLKAAGIDRFFERRLISAEVGSEKPDAGIFREGLRQLNVAPWRVIHVGDFYEIDVRGARGVGITPVLMDVADLSADRDCVRVRSLTELADLLRA